MGSTVAAQFPGPLGGEELVGVCCETVRAAEREQPQRETPRRDVGRLNRLVAVDLRLCPAVQLEMLNRLAAEPI